MKKLEKKALNILCIGLGILLCLVSVIATTAIKTNFGKSEIIDTKIISLSGYDLASRIYKPSQATTKTPAPLILIQHGGNVSKERVEQYAIELARRGYVSILTDMYSHGSSQALPDSQWLTAGRGMYDEMKYAITLPFVDKNKVALLGISRGGKAASESLQLDNKEGNVIKAIYLIHSDPIYKDTTGFVDVYGARDIGVLADNNDEFFFSEMINDTGTYSNDANKYAQILSSPRDYLVNKSAQSFLYFGTDAPGRENRLAETVYKKDFGNGKTGTRLINVSNQYHMSAEYSTLVMNKSLEFFKNVMPSSVSLATTDYTYTIGNVFGVVGMLGLLLFLASVAIYITRQRKMFASLGQEVPELRHVGSKAGVLWFVATQVIGIVGTYLIISILNALKLSAYWDPIFRSANPIYYSLICLISGALSLAMCLLWYRFYGKKNGFSLNKTGLITNVKSVSLAGLVALLSVGLFYLIIFVTHYLTPTDYLAAWIGFLPFGANRIAGMLIILPLFVTGFIIMSISVNCFGFCDVLGKNKLVNNLIMSFIMAIPTLFIILYVIGGMKLTGQNPMIGGLRSAASAVMTFPVLIFIFTFISRTIYEKTGNPYIGGIINGMLASITSWMPCEIRVPEAGAPFTFNFMLAGLIVGALAVIVICLVLFTRDASKRGSVQKFPAVPELAE